MASTASAMIAITSTEHLHVLIGSWFGLGFVEPFHSGLAVASAWPIVMVLSVRHTAVRAAVTLAIMIAGVWSAEMWQALSSVKDDARIVIDEVGGYIAGLCLFGRLRWLTAGAFGALFLVLDRLKPWPFEWIETVPGGAGVMLDDIAVGLTLGLALLFAMSVGRRYGRS